MNLQFQRSFLINKCFSTVFQGWTLCLFSKKYLKQAQIRYVFTYRNTFKYDELHISVFAPTLKTPKPQCWQLKSRNNFCDHMFKVDWNSDSGWGIPRICPVHNLMLHPASKVLHYCQTVLDGIKAFRAEDDRLLLFRPEDHINRMLSASVRTALPVFDGKEFLYCIKKLIRIDQDWLHDYSNCSLYIRPFYFGTEPSLGAEASEQATLVVISSPYRERHYHNPNSPLHLIADDHYVHSWPGGTGDLKMGSNYAPTLYFQKLAEKKHFHQVLWLFGEEHRITETSNMNIFILIRNDQDEKELVTPPLDGLILPGIIRDSVLELCRKWDEFKVSERFITMQELIKTRKRHGLLEAFCTGTDHGISPIASIFYAGQDIDFPVEFHKCREFVTHRLFNALFDIQHGRIPSTWVHEID